MVCPRAVADTLIIGLHRIDDVCSRFATKDLERQMLGVTGCTYSITRGSCVLFGRRFRLPELVSVDITRAPTIEGGSARTWEGAEVRVPVGKYEETAVFRPVHATNHGRFIDEAYFYILKDIVWTCEAF